MSWWLFMFGACGVMVMMYLLMTFYMRSKDGLQPGYAGLVIMVASFLCFFTAIFVMRRFGIDLHQGRPREIFWMVLGIVWIVLAVRIHYERSASGTVLMDLGRAPAFGLMTVFSIVMLAIGIANVVRAEPRAESFSYIAWSLWFFAMSRGRLQVRERGILSGGLVPWRHISRCVATAENAVRLNLKKGLRRNVDIKLPPHLRDRFIELVDARI